MIGEIKIIGSTGTKYYVYDDAKPFYHTHKIAYAPNASSAARLWYENHGAGLPVTVYVHRIDQLGNVIEPGYGIVLLEAVDGRC